MKSMIPQILRITGIVVTALLIPISILALLSLQWLGGNYQTVEILHIAWALANFIGMPFMLLGFIIRYSIPTVIYFAAAHFTLSLSLANVTLLITSAAKGSAMLLAIVAIPSALYIIGFLIHRQKKNQPPEEKQTDDTETE